MTTVWINSSALEDMVEEACSRYPVETGGVLLGYAADNTDVVVQCAIGPGPNAQHSRYRFVPDHAWQCEQIDHHYAASSGIEVYIGEWHTHPGSSAWMSLLDRRTLGRIARHREASCPHPLMIIAGGSPRGWNWKAHQFVKSALFGLSTTSAERPLQRFSS